MPGSHSRTSRFGSPRRGAVLGLLLLLSAAPSADRLAAQLGPVIAGGVLGAAGGAVTTVGLVTAQARAGRYLWSTNLVRWQMLPIPIGAITGASLGAHSGNHLWDTTRDGVIGFVGGAAVGALLGRVVWKDREGAWAGGVIGGASGLVIGSLVGALRWKDDLPTPSPLLNFSIPIGR